MQQASFIAAVGFVQKPFAIKLPAFQRDARILEQYRRGG